MAQGSSLSNLFRAMSTQSTNGPPLYHSVTPLPSCSSCPPSFEDKTNRKVTTDTSNAGGMCARCRSELSTTGTVRSGTRRGARIRRVLTAPEVHAYYRCEKVHFYLAVLFIGVVVVGFACEFGYLWKFKQLGSADGVLSLADLRAKEAKKVLIEVTIYQTKLQGRDASALVDEGDQLYWEIKEQIDRRNSILPNYPLIFFIPGLILVGLLIQHRDNYDRKNVELRVCDHPEDLWALIKAAKKFKVIGNKGLILGCLIFIGCLALFSWYKNK